MIDYRELLKKYMDNVGQHEGVYFLPAYSERINEEENNELSKLAEEIKDWYIEL